MKIFIRIVITLLVFIIAGCSGTKVRKDKPADAMFQEATDYFDRKNYEEAISTFQEVAAKYPMSKYAVTAKLKIADAHFNNENYPEAVSAYREFEKLHPTNENIPYAIYQIGLSYFNQLLTIDRDQGATSNAVVEFTRLISRFPDSKYTEDAKKNIEICRNNLAEHEFYIGSFYFKKEKFKAAKERFISLITKYPDSKEMDKYLFYAGMSYINTNDSEKGNVLLKTLQDRYPDSKFTQDAKELTDIYNNR